MTTFANGDSGLSVRTKINNVLQHADGTAGELVINEAGADVDFRVESDTLANALLVDGATGNVGIGANSPYTKLDIVQATAGHGGWKYGASLNATDFPALRFLATTGNTGSIIAHEAGATVFLTGTTATGAGTERMRIDASGNLLVGTTAYPTSVGTSGVGIRNVSGIVGQIAIGKTSSGASDVQTFYHNGTYVGGVQISETTTTFLTSSDYRLKEDLQPIADASLRLAALNPVNFAWKADGTRTDGFIAHEVQAVAPQAVTGEKDGEAMQAIDHSKLVPLLTAALQEALAKIALLETRITALEA